MHAHSIKARINNDSRLVLVWISYNVFKMREKKNKNIVIGNTSKEGHFVEILMNARTPCAPKIGTERILIHSEVLEEAWAHQEHICLITWQ